MATSLLGGAKTALLRGAAMVGLPSVLESSGWRGNRLLILCYHGLSLADEHEWSNLYVTADHLERRLEMIRRGGYTVIPLSEGVRGLYEGDLPPRSVVVTFDDGFADFYLKAHPVLRHFSTPTTLYLTTYYTRDQRPVFDPFLSYLFWKGAGTSVSLPRVFESSVEIPRDPLARDRLHGEVLARVKGEGWSAEEKDRLARGVCRDLGIDYEDLAERRLFYLMREDEIRDLDAGLIDVQLHTHRHRTPRDERPFVDEVLDNRRAIEDMLPGRARLEHFCYPSGDYDTMFLPWLREIGVVSATTCDTGLAGPRDNPLLLPRLIDTMHLPDVVFESWLTGVAALLPKRPGGA